MSSDYGFIAGYGALTSFWVVYFSLLYGVIYSIGIGIVSVGLLYLLDCYWVDPEFSIFNWGNRKQTLIYGVDIVAVETATNEIVWVNPKQLRDMGFTSAHPKKHR